MPTLNLLDIKISMLQASLQENLSIKAV